MRRPHKIIDDLQLENSNLMRRVKELEQNPHLSEEEEQSATEGNTVDTQSNQIRHFSRTYAYTVNMFIAAKECAPSKDAKNYCPSQRFGMHRREGDFCEFLDHLPEEFQDDLKNKDRLSLFAQTVEFPHRCHETMELTYSSLVHICSWRGSALGCEYTEDGWTGHSLPILSKQWNTTSCTP